MTTSTQAAPEVGTEVPFSKIVEAMARRSCQEGGATPMRALVATVVVVGPQNRLGLAAEALQSLADAGTVRGILISDGTNPAPPARVAGNTAVLFGLKPEYVNNAVAALRLSSLPTLVWWRGGRPDTLEGLADLADRVVLDEEDPRPIWARALTLVDDTAFSDIRWARLTQCRALMAHFFDIPEVQAAASDFQRVDIVASDRLSGELFAAWLTTSLHFNEQFVVDIKEGDDAALPLQEIRLADHEQELRLRLGTSKKCVETAVSVHGHRSASRIVSLDDQTLSGVLTEELRIRARDMAFERALRAVVGDGGTGANGVRV
jgi:glucose-6-phosphate dehydrogenase assembly protein OpcA